MKVLLIHWNEAEARKRASRLEGGGRSVRLFWSTDAAALERLAAEPPDVAVIDLSRTPSHGREIGGWLRRRKATRRTALVFVGGAPEKVARTRELLPDATYLSWEDLPGALDTVPPVDAERVTVPGAMAGYSGTPLPRKLGIREGGRVALLGAPEGFHELLRPLPGDVAVRSGGEPTEPAGVVLLFVRSRDDLAGRLEDAVRLVADSGRLWICWPKKASGVLTDLTQNAVRDAGLARGLVDYKIAAIDATWSGLCFAFRR